MQEIQPEEKILHRVLFILPVEGYASPLNSPLLVGGCRPNIWRTGAAPGGTLRPCGPQRTSFGPGHRPGATFHGPEDIRDCYSPTPGNLAASSAVWVAPSAEVAWNRPCRRPLCTSAPHLAGLGQGFLQ
ncbi:uncharacterized protein LOC108139234 [Drosophila elegans]|uniref:uncharacterized protein LOC108139234 n=1 Tax=Drosophila elegans TaxID=30023 RepID=UPI001BC84381|nr:uncharacterized protein LOC108139234 [Drosophila elegans]